MTRVVFVLVGAMALWSCVEPVILGSDVDEKPSGCDGALQPPTLSCPAIDAGTAAQFATPAELRAVLLGRWAFCGGTRRATGRGELPGFFGGAGVEFWEASGALHFAFLVETTTDYERRAEAWTQGTVRIEQVGGQSRVVLVAVDGVEVPWALEFFEPVRVLRNGGFDQWDFVPID